MHTRSTFTLCALAALATLSLAAGCGDGSDGSGTDPTDPTDPTEPTDPGATPACVGELLPLQNPRSHTLGETFYLPSLASSCPDGASWTVTEAPAGSENRVYSEGTSSPRFTPDVAGQYRFAVTGLAEELELTVVARSLAERFRNHYLTPLYGATRVGDEIWVANGATYSVTRLVNDNGWRVADEVTVGAWPSSVAGDDGLPYVLVAQRGSDTLGFIDRDRGVLEDALWVGDEPTAVLLSPDGARAYVSLPTMGEVAVVDVEARVVSERIEVGFDPRAMALSEDGSRLFVASYRSGDRDVDTMRDYGPGDDEDLWIVDTATAEVIDRVSGLSAELRAIDVDGDELAVVGTAGDPIPSQADGSSFVHQVLVGEAENLAQTLRRADLSRQPSAAAVVVNPSGVLLAGDSIWVAAESSGIVVQLDRQTLEERARFEVGAGPRQLIDLGDGAVAVHCYMSLELWIIGSSGVTSVRLADDARPADVAAGEQIFTRPGGDYASQHSCSSCHVEAQNEGMRWRFGPRDWANVRPIQLLAATEPIGWAGYVSRYENFAYQGPASIVARPVAAEEAAALEAFLGSLIGAPAANQHTRLDGSYTEAALRGEALFEGKAKCSLCHTPPLYTSRQMIEVGKSGVPADVPSLLGVYRHGIYFVHGQAKGIPEALAVAIDYTEAELDDQEQADLLAFVSQLTAKGAAPLGQWPEKDATAVYPDARPWLAFSEPVDSSQSSSAEELAAQHVKLIDEDDQPVAGAVVLEGQRIGFVPAEPLAAGRYRYVVGEGLPFLTGGSLNADRTIDFEVAAAPQPLPSDSLRMLVTVAFGGPPTDVEMRLQVSPGDGNGGAVPIEIRPAAVPTQQQDGWVRIDASSFTMSSFAMPLGPRALADARSITATLRTDGGPIVAEGTLTITAPGITVPNVPFRIERP